MTNQEDRLRVYLACRPIFSGKNAKLQNGKQVNKLVRKNKGRLEPLIKAMTEERLFAIVQSLHDKNVFKSEVAAKVEFPDLFQPSPSEQAPRQGPEHEAVKPVAKALDETASEGWDTEEAESQCAGGTSAEPPNAADERAAEPDAEAVSCVPQPGVANGKGPATETDHGCIPPAEPVPIESMPSLHPYYLPYETQHCILTVAQQALEECCFDFATKNMPGLLEGKGWDCAAAVELTKWLSIFRQEVVEAYVGPFFASVGGAGSGGLFASLTKLRNSAVHREPVEAKDVSQLLDSAIKLAQILQDYRRAAQLEDVRDELESKIEVIELRKALLEESFTAGFLDIQRQREELDLREKALIEGTVKEDRQNNVFIGQLLEEHVQGTFGKGKRVRVPHGVEGQCVDYKAERDRIEQSLRVDHGAGINGAVENPGGDDDYYYDSLEEITNGTLLDEAD